MDILYFQGVRPFSFGGGNYHGHSLLPRGYAPLGLGGRTTMDAPLGWGELSWTSFTSKGYDPLGWGGELSWTSFTSKGYDPLGLGGELSWTSFTSKGVRAFWLGGNYPGHPLLPRGMTL